MLYVHVIFYEPCNEQCHNKEVNSIHKITKASLTFLLHLLLGLGDDKIVNERFRCCSSNFCGDLNLSFMKISDLSLA
jgi:hypothetical protein